MRTKFILVNPFVVFDMWQVEEFYCTCKRAALIPIPRKGHAQLTGMFKVGIDIGMKLNELFRNNRPKGIRSVLALANDNTFTK